MPTATPPPATSGTQTIAGTTTTPITASHFGRINAVASENDEMLYASGLFVYVTNKAAASRGTPPSQPRLLGGKEAVGFFLTSGLPRPVLREIWNVANNRDDHHLDVNRFAVAVRLVSLSQNTRLNVVNADTLAHSRGVRLPLAL